MEVPVNQLLDEAALQAAPYFASLDEAVANPDQCYKLRLMHSEDVATLEKYLPRLPNLQHIYFDYHKSLDEVPEIIGQVHGLQEIMMRACSFATFHPAIGELEHLRLVDIERCDNLTEFPEFLRDITELSYLRISECPVASVPDFVGQLVQLQDLVLRETQISSLPDTIAYLANLEYLRVYPAATTLSVPIGLKRCGALKKFVHARLEVRGGTEEALKTFLPNTEFDLIP